MDHILDCPLLHQTCSINVLIVHYNTGKDGIKQVPTTPACKWWNRPEENFSSGKLESTHPSRTVVKSIEFFMELSLSCAATLTHYSTEPMTTGPDYEPLLRLLALAGYVHPYPESPRYPCSVCFKT